MLPQLRVDADRLAGRQDEQDSVCSSESLTLLDSPAKTMQATRTPVSAPSRNAKGLDL